MDSAEHKVEEERCSQSASSLSLQTYLMTRNNEVDCVESMEESDM